MRIVRALVILVALGLASGQSQAQSLWALVVANCGTPPVTYNAGLSYQVLMDTTGKLCDGASGSSATNPLYVTGNVGGFESGTAPVQTATPANSSHAAGVSVGGLFSVPMLRTAGGGGLLEYIPVMSVGGDTPTLQVRVWDRKPTNSNFACTDGSAYADGSGSTGGTVGADQSHMLPGCPQSVTLAAPTNTTGDAKTYGTISLLPPISVLNQDSTPTKNIYVCLVATTTYTPGGAAYYVNAIGPQD